MNRFHCDVRQWFAIVIVIVPEITPAGINRNCKAFSPALRAALEWRPACPACVAHIRRSQIRRESQSSGLTDNVVLISGASRGLGLVLARKFAGAHAAFWQYFGASLQYLVLALCFATFVLGDSAQVMSLHPYLRKR
jgi:hypothetical protein